MKWLLLFLILFCAGCSYWPQAAQPKYYSDGIKDVKEDIDDIAGARTL